ncbi:MAG: cobyrinate a,c-diamide synthase [Candidatus Thermoplasmatota archaeon]|nr:cobyrinate a,c-diamide synthase [Candidatus Thermoplasmatota archaeon]MDA8144374.1 cobyrinate a,c-diamide synthase [Thermoplasmatales archaeon]
MKVIGISAPVTGSGKTSVTLAVLSHLKNAIAFKIGPDYIDGGLSSVISGTRTMNIDRWIQGRNYMNQFAEASRKFDYGIVEGVMGLHDSGSQNNLSTHYYFRKFGIPYILVVDVRKMAESAYYMARGSLGSGAIGVIINNYVSEKHFEMVAREFRKRGVKIIGAIPYMEELKIPERHLGLHTSLEVGNLHEIAQKISKYIDFSFLENLADVRYPLPKKHKVGVTNKEIWIAYDRAFNFYYADSLSLLESIGRVRYFSPLEDEVPENPDFIYLGGGYPELYADQLSRSYRLMSFLRNYSESGKPMLAECGGLMYLEGTIESDRGELKMTGVFNGTVKKNRKLTLAYTKLLAKEDTLLFRKGEIAYGHEFHYSDVEDSDPKILKNLIGRGIDGNDGLQSRNTVGSYSHFSLERYKKRLVRSILSS